MTYLPKNAHVLNAVYNYKPPDVLIEDRKIAADSP